MLELGAGLFVSGGGLFLLELVFVLELLLLSPVKESLNGGLAGDVLVC